MTTATTVQTGTVELAPAYRQLLSATPGLRIRDAAQKLGASEAELVASNVDASSVRLADDWTGLLAELPKLGKVMTLTRNEFAVHEKVGAFEDVTASGKFGLVLGPDIDLRIFLDRWHFGFAVDKPVEGKSQRSLQFFDSDGTAVHKIFLRHDSDTEAYDAIVERFATPNDVAPLQLNSVPEMEPDCPDGEVDIVGLHTAWKSLKDTHEFHPMLRRFKVGRVQALRLIGRDFARQVSVGSFRSIVEAAAGDGTEIMVFVGSRGCIQIHTGPVRKLKTYGAWFNVVDPGFNLHLREDAIASAWVVRKPTVDGVVTSLEIFDQSNQVIALTFGKRMPGEPELASWLALVAGIERNGAEA